ncbi:F-box/LRR-repeat protein fbxl-1-like [Aphidius gifuensis]|uniref:F-box/LRR-repeat protein fbxl-1-like n=1 Tax=Aphidius gifuensis TaxID=684658 RepID=UPI001CDC850F|nr:F-box/LRR-repeat protein fbxl-1-like [Aphidius gifuensis]
MSAKKICRYEEQQSSDNAAAKINPIDILDYDALSNIFMQLPISDRMVMEKVCLKWKEACELAWYDIKKFKCTNRIVHFNEKRWLTQSFVKKVLKKCGTYLNELSLSLVCNSNIMPCVVNNCKNLTSLEFVITETPRYNDNDYLAFKELDKLKFIKIHVNNDGYYKNEESINFRSEAINDLPAKVSEILLIYSESIHLRPVFFNLKKFTNLHSLTLRNCRLDDIIEDISETITLVKLDLQDSLIIEKNNMLFDKLVNLEHVSIRRSLVLLDYHQNLLDSISNTCKKLRHLEINVNKSLAESTLQTLTEIKNLEYLILPSGLKLSGETIMIISNNCKKLKHLEMTNCTINPVSALDELSKLQHLEYLNLSDAKDILNSSIMAIAYKCKNLKYLNINNCNLITERALFTLTTLEKLKKLNVGDIDGVTDEFIVRLKRFKSLDFHRCKNITGNGIVQLIKNCPDLEDLNLRLTVFIVRKTT